MAICASFVVLMPLLRFVLNRTAAPWLLQTEFLYRFTLTQSDALLLGGLCALLWRGSHRGQLQRTARILAPLGTLAASLYLLFVVRSWRIFPDQTPYPHWIFTGGLLFVDWYAAALIVCALIPGNIVYRLFHVRPLRWLGRLSYGAYVFHDLIHGLYAHIVAHIGGEPLRHRPVLWQEWTAALALPSTILLAWLSFRFFESPFLNLKERWTVRPTPTPDRALRQPAT